MSALSKLPSADARQACVALGQETAWPAEEWAIATRRLLDNDMPMQEMGLTRLIELSLKTGAAPSEIAERMVLEYKRALAALAHKPGAFPDVSGPASGQTPA